MDGSERKILIVLLLSTAVRTLTDSFAFGILFVIALQNAGESTAALVNSIGLFLILIFSPFIGRLLDNKVLSVRLSALFYGLTGSGMLLFLYDFNFRFIIYTNLVLLVVFNIPASLFLSSCSSKIFSGKPASGYSFLASVNTLCYIIGTISGAYLVQNDLLMSWVIIKLISSVFAALILMLGFRILGSHIPLASEPDQINNGNAPPFFSNTGKGIISTSFVNLKVLRLSVYNKLRQVDRSLLVFAFCIAVFTFARVFYLTNVAFEIYTIFDENLLLYTLLINTAALSAFVIFPFVGILADRFGSWKLFFVSVICTPLYFIAFIIFSNHIILIVLWALPIGVFSEVAQIGIVSQLTDPKNRNTAIGIVTSAISLGAVLGSMGLSYFVNKGSLDIVLFLQILLPIFLLIPLQVISRKEKMF